MPLTTLCRLCVTNSNSFQSLYDDSGQFSGIYHMAVKYFDPIILLQTAENPAPSVICTECWQTIHNFHTFQQSVINNHHHLEYMKPLVLINKLEEDQNLNVIEKGDEEDNYEISDVMLSDKEIRSKEEIPIDISTKQSDMEIDTLDLLKHLRKIHNECDKGIVHKCDQCTASFLQAASLRRHRSVHKKDGKYPYSCDLCGDSFTNGSNLKKHMLAQHKEEPLPQYYFCEQCNRMFKFRVSLEKHMEKFHSDIVKNDRPSKEVSGVNNVDVTENHEENLNYGIHMINREFHKDIQISHTKNESNCKEVVVNNNRNDDYEIHYIFPEAKENEEQPTTYAYSEIHSTRARVLYTTNNDDDDINPGYRSKISKFSEFTENKNQSILKNSYNDDIPTNSYNTRDSSYNNDENHKFHKPTVSYDNSDENLKFQPNITENLCLQGETQKPIMDISNETTVAAYDDSDVELTEMGQSDIQFEEILSTKSMTRKEKELEYDHLIAKYKGYLDCPLCKKRVANYALLSKHFGIKHKGKSCYVNCCQLKLNNRHRICKHLRVHINPSAYECNICKKCFKNTGSLVLHKLLIHIEQDVTNRHNTICQCKKSKDLYARYLNPTTEGMNIEEASNSKNQKDRDIFNLENYKRFCCKIKRIILQNDATIAKAKRELYCRICNVQFSYYSLLRDHFYHKHPGENFYIVCCERKFFKNIDLLDHIHVHLAPNKKSSECDICNVLFERQSSYEKHMISKHKDLTKSIDATAESTTADFKSKDTNQCSDKPSELRRTNSYSDNKGRAELDEYIVKWKGKLECVICKDNLDTYSLLSKHFQYKHKGQKCHVVCCGRKIYKRYLLVGHIRRCHNTKKSVPKCTICDLSFSAYFKLLRHNDKVHNPKDGNAHKCEICGASFPKSFSLTKHIRNKHNETQSPTRWSCPECNIAFENEISLEKHKKNDHSNKNYENKLNLPQVVNDVTEEKCKMSIKQEISHDPIVSNDEDKLLSIAHEILPTNSSTIYTENLIQEEEIVQNLPQVVNYISEEKYKISVKQEISNDPIVSNDDEDITHDIISENSTNIHTEHSIQMPDLDIIDIKSEKYYSSDNSDSNNQYDSNNHNQVPIKPTDMEEDIISINSNNNKQLIPYLYDDFIVKWKGDLKCPVCEANFSTYSTLSEHFDRDHTNETCYTICCHLVFSGRLDIVDHIRTHVNPKAFQCNLCQKCFKNASNKEHHRKRVHSDGAHIKNKKRVYVCPDEDPTHKIQTSTSRADGTSNKIPKFCPRKEARLYYDETIAKWMPQLDCRICKAKFSHFCQMRAHFKSEHPQEKCYIVCCQRNYYKASDAVDHILLHLDPYSFKCGICNVPLANKIGLNRHMRGQHYEMLGGKKWECNDCGKKFQRNYTLNKHIKVKHSKIA